MATFKKVDAVSEAIRGFIIDGKFRANERLPENRFTEILQVSRTPLREAFIRLEQEGLIVRERGGYRVRSFSLAEVIDAIKLRGILEGAAARLAALQELSSKELTPVKKIVDSIDEIIQYESYSEYGNLNTAFHEEMSKLCKSEYIRMEVLRSYRFPFAHPSGFATNRTGLLHLHQTIKSGNHQHREIIEAIETHRPQDAFELCVNHAEHAIRNVEIAFLERSKNMDDKHNSISLIFPIEKT